MAILYGSKEITIEKELSAQKERMAILYASKEIEKELSAHKEREEAPLKNLILRGGGSKGIAYIGMLQALMKTEKLRSLETCAGSSAGAITALVVALHDDPTPIFEQLETVNLKDLQGISADGKSTKIEAKMKYVIEEALEKLKKLENPNQEDKNFINSLNSDNLTFEKLKELKTKLDKYPEYKGKIKNLIVTGTENRNFDVPQTIYFGQDPYYNNTPIYKAVAASASFPFLFEKVIVCNLAKDTNLQSNSLESNTLYLRKTKNENEKALIYKIKLKDCVIASATITEQDLGEETFKKFIEILNGSTNEEDAFQALAYKQKQDLFNIVVKNDHIHKITDGGVLDNLPLAPFIPKINFLALDTDPAKHVKNTLYLKKSGITNSIGYRFIFENGQVETGDFRKENLSIDTFDFLQAKLRSGLSLSTITAEQKKELISVFSRKIPNQCLVAALETKDATSYTNLLYRPEETSGFSFDPQKIAGDLISKFQHGKSLEQEARNIRDHFERCLLPLNSGIISTTSTNVSAATRRDVIAEAYITTLEYLYNNSLVFEGANIFKIEPDELSSDRRAMLENFKQLEKSLGSALEKIANEITILTKAENSKVKTSDPKIKALENLKSNLNHQKTEIHTLIHNKNACYYTKDNFNFYREKTTKIIEDTANLPQVKNDTVFRNILNIVTRPLAAILGLVTFKLSLAKHGFFNSPTHATLNNLANRVKTGETDLEVMPSNSRSK